MKSHQDIGLELSGQNFLAPERITFAYNRGIIIGSYPLAVNLLNQIYELSKETEPHKIKADFMKNSSKLSAAARIKIGDIVSKSEYESACGKGCCCPAIRGCRMLNFRMPVTDEPAEVPSVDMMITVSCHNAMLSRVKSPQAVEAPGVTLLKINSKRKKSVIGPNLYTGVRIFSEGCYNELGSLALRTAELIAEEVE